jgi:hypothetical protein
MGCWSLRETYELGKLLPGLDQTRAGLAVKKPETVFASKLMVERTKRNYAKKKKKKKINNKIK